MTILEKKSERKKKALINLVKSGEYTIAYALMEAERLNDEGKLLDNDYEEVAEYLESLLEPVEDEAQEETQDEAQVVESEAE
jgi:predicted AlkP superfamily phosphohydrolase/phosphomutase